MDGFIIINKPAGWTSHDVVARVRTILSIKKAGHTGTLDPLATGVLVLSVGKATRLIQYLPEETKEYYGEMNLGLSTDTQDSTGKIVNQKTCRVDESQVIEVFKKFQGEIVQVPPLTSAVKLRGKPLYKWTRQGVAVKPPPRKVKIFELKFLNLIKRQNPVVAFNVKCAKGTYVRTLCSDVGEKLNCGGSLSKLVRIASGDFVLKKAVSLNELEKYVEADRLSEIIITPADALKKYPSLVVREDFVSKVLKGAPLSQEMLSEEPPQATKGSLLRVLDLRQNLLAMATALAALPPDNKNALLAQPVCVLS